MSDNDLSRRVLGAAIDVHRELGPGLLESAYEAALDFELAERELHVVRQRRLPVEYKDVHLDCGYRLDFLVEDDLIVELKAVDELRPIHRAQALSYLKQSDAELALLLNFNVELLKTGIHRFVD